MSWLLLVLAPIAIAAAGTLFFFVVRRRPRHLKQSYFQTQWKTIQKLCADRTQWAEALIQADKLLNEALKKRRFGGKSMGERLVSAQRSFQDNDSVWYGHKLRLRIEQQPEHRLKKWEIKDALLGIGQALKDLEAL